MNAAVFEGHRPSEVLAHQDVGSIQRLARITGLLYLILAALGMFAPIVLETLVVPGDATATADRLVGSQWLFAGSLVAWIAIVIVDVALAVAFYLLLAPVSRVHSLVTAAFRLVYSAMLGAFLVNLLDAYLLLTNSTSAAGHDSQVLDSQALSALDTFDTGFLLALIFFGIHLVALGLLLYRSRYVPRALGALLAAGGVGYIVDSLASLLVEGYSGLATAILLAPAVVGELGIAVWLLVKGVSVRRPSAAELSPILG
ncbi:MAG TPA: DUF4386 domain-containing protein [Jiangellaceae bacterium]|nr:DUF4386 domain-containing protein [Jiangellaceae bacterium]